MRFDTASTSNQNIKEMENIMPINEIVKIVSVLVFMGLPCFILLQVAWDKMCQNANKAVWRLEVAAYQCTRWNDAMIKELMRTTKGDEHTRVAYMNSILEYMRKSGCSWNDAVEHAIISSIERTDYCIRMGWFNNRTDWRAILEPMKF